MTVHDKLLLWVFLRFFKFSWCLVQVISYFKHPCRVLFVFQILSMHNSVSPIPIWSFWGNKWMPMMHLLYVPFELWSKSIFWWKSTHVHGLSFERVSVNFFSCAQFSRYEWRKGSEWCCFLATAQKSQKQSKQTGKISRHPNFQCFHRGSTWFHWGHILPNKAALIKMR